MFSLLLQAKNKQMSQLSEYIGSIGVEGGQGDADYNFGERRGRCVG
jgi:hypothetical protein